jgi:hypothetical protein
MAKNMHTFKLLEGLDREPFYPALFNMVMDEVTRRGLEGQESGIPKTILCAGDAVMLIPNKGTLVTKFFFLSFFFYLVCRF